jgi:hypothetical protein
MSRERTMSRDTRGLCRDGGHQGRVALGAADLALSPSQSPIAAVHSRREYEDEEAYQEQGHHRPEDHGNRTVSHGATRRIPRSRATAAVTSTRVFMVDMGVALRWQDERWAAASAKSDERTSSVIGAACAQVGRASLN